MTPSAPLMVMSLVYCLDTDFNLKMDGHVSNICKKSSKQTIVWLKKNGKEGEGLNVLSLLIYFV